MHSVVISYRSDDTFDFAERVCKCLSGFFTGTHSFVPMDDDSVPLRVDMDFRIHLSDAIREAAAVIAIIGEHWRTDSRGVVRLEDPFDFVRMQLETALSHGVPVLPLLIGAARMPHSHELPPSLRDFALRQGLPVDTGRNFSRDMDAVVGELEGLFGHRAPRDTMSRTAKRLFAEAIEFWRGGPHRPPPDVKVASVPFKEERPAPRTADPVRETVRAVETPPTTPGRRDIFVSYAREDENRITSICKLLEENGWSVFWDRRIPAGKTWHTNIETELETARCVIVAWSRHSIASDWVIEEAGAAKERQVLVPIKLDDVKPPFGFRHIQAADLTKWMSGQDSIVIGQLLKDITAIAPPAASR